MGPIRGSKEYAEQVETIVTGIGEIQDLTNSELEALLFVYVQDESYSRGAIVEAEKELRRRMRTVRYYAEDVPLHNPEPGEFRWTFTFPLHGGKVLEVVVGRKGHNAIKEIFEQELRDNEESDPGV